MSNPIWRRFPGALELHCLEMKDHAQDRIMEETRNAAPDKLMAYFREASRRFWQQVGRDYPEFASTRMAVRETDESVALSRGSPQAGTPSSSRAAP